MRSIKDFANQNWPPTCNEDVITQYDSLSLSSSETDNVTLDSGIYCDSKSDLLKKSVSSNLATKELPPPPPPPPYNSNHNIISSNLDSTDLQRPFHFENIENSVPNSNVDHCSHNDLLDKQNLQNPLSQSISRVFSSQPLSEERKEVECLQSNIVTESPQYQGNIQNDVLLNVKKNNLQKSQPTDYIPYDMLHNRNVGKPLHSCLKSEWQFDHKIEEVQDEIKILGACNKCQCLVTDSESACIALGNLYHSNCFTCCYCSRSLRGKVFYKDKEKIYCENDYMVYGFHKSVKICNACGHIITETILEALGKDFHPRCFKCSICQKCLDGVPFTVDRNNNIYCIIDYHNTFAPRCAVCLKPIIPCKDSDDVVRVVVNDRDFHVECYRCQNCLRLLSNESNCFVWTTDRSEATIKLLCRKCYVNEIRELSRLKQH